MIKPPREQPRAPAAFAYDDTEADQQSVRMPSEPRKPGSFSGEIVLTADEDDPFINPAKDVPDVPVAAPRKRKRSFAKIALGAFGVLFSLPSGFGQTASSTISFPGPTGWATRLSPHSLSASWLSSPSSCVKRPA